MLSNWVEDHCFRIGLSERLSTPFYQLWSYNCQHENSLGRQNTRGCFAGCDNRTHSPEVAVVLSPRWRFEDRCMES